MKKLLFVLLTALLTVPAALAQSWYGQQVDPTQYTGTGHVIYVKLVDPNYTQGGQETYDLNAYSIVAMIGEGANAQLRSYESEPLGNGQAATQTVHYFPIRVYGGTADNGKTISFRLWDSWTLTEYVLPLTVTYTDGSTAQYPSQATPVNFTPVQSFYYPNEFYVGKGQTRTYPVTYEPENATTPIITLTFNNPTRNVTISGMDVTGVEYGYYDLLVNGGGKIWGEVINPVKTVTVTDPEKLYVGDVRMIDFTITGEDANDTEHMNYRIGVTYNNPTIVNQTDNPTAYVPQEYEALAKGTATATFSVSDPTKDAPIEKTVNFNVLQPITDITVPTDPQTIWYHNRYYVSDFYTVTPANADEKVAYGLTDASTSVISIDDNGLITPLGTGRAQINVWPEDHPNTVKTFWLEVVKAATDFTPKSDPVYMLKNESLSAYNLVDVLPQDYTVPPTFTFNSSNESVVAVVPDQGNGPQIQAVASGTATVTINMSYPNIPELQKLYVSKTIQVIVTEKVTGFTFEGLEEGDNGVWVCNGETTSIVLKAVPEGALFDPAKVTVGDDGYSRVGYDVTEEQGECHVEITPDLIGSTDFYVRLEDGTEAGVSSQFVLHVGQKYVFNEGWNWTSSLFDTNVVPGKSQFVNLYDIFGNDLSEMRSFTDMVINDPEWGYVGGIDAFTYDHYKVKMAVGKTIIAYGTVFNEANAVTVPLNENWTWVPNLYQHKIDLNFATDYWRSNFVDGTQLITKNGQAEWTWDDLAQRGEWTPNLVLNPGEAFLVKAVFPDYSIVYPQADQIKYPYFEDTNNAPAKKYWSYDQSRFVSNMALTAQIVDLPEAESYTVGAFVGDECRGESVYAKDRWFVVAHGESEEVVTLKLMNKATGAIYDLDGAYDFTQSLGSIKNPVEIESPVVIIDGIESVNANAAFTVEGNTIVGEGIAIFDLSGRNVTESNGALNTGIYIVKAFGVTAKVSVK